MNIRLLSALLLFLAPALFGQAAGGVAGISGVVRDPSGAAIPNAKVVVSSDTLGGLRTLNTNDAGLFSAPALVPGPGYKVTVAASGFAGYEMKEIVLTVGQQLDLNVQLSVAQASTAVEVSAETPLVESSKTDVSGVIDNRQITDLPINGRRVDTFVLLTPGVTNDGTFGLISFRGTAGHNAFLVDGNDSTQQYYNENAGRTRIATQISQDAVQEFQVVSANYSAEYGRAMGGVVNTVTKSGTNNIHGTAYWFFRNRTLNARDRYATFNPPEVRHQTGASVGGPIRKDKLFYFLNVDFTRRNFPAVDSLNSPTIISPVTISFLGCGAPATAAQCTAINGILPRFFGTVPRTADNDLYFGKLDYRPTERHAFSASLNYMRFLSPNGIQTGAVYTNGAAVGNNGDDSVRVRNGRFTWTYVPSSSFVNEFRFGWATDRQADTFNNSLLPQGIGLISLSVAGVSGLGAGANYLPRLQPNEQRFQFVDNATWMKRRHIVKFGADIANSQDYVYNIINAFGSYSYQTVTNFALDFSNQSLNTNPGRHWQSYAQTFGNPVVDFTIRDFGFYMQDQWRVTDRLTVNFGARYDYAQVPQPPLSNKDYPQTGHIASSNLNLAPRLGVTYRLNDKTVLRAGYGMFHARFIGSLVNNLFVNNGIYQTAITLQGNNAAQLAAGPTYPNTIPAVPTGASIAASSIQFADPNLKTPYSQQGTVAIERQFGRDISLTVSYIWSRGIKLFAVRDLNINPPTTRFTYAIQDENGNQTGTYSTLVYQTPRPDTRYGGVFQVENGINSYYNALAVQARKRFSHGFQSYLSYTWSHLIDTGQSSGSNALFFSNLNLYTYNGDYKFDRGTGTLDHRHRLSLNFVWAPTITRRSGFVYKYLVNNWQLSNIVTMGSGRPVSPTIRTATPNPVANMLNTSTVNGLGGNFRVPFWPVNSLQTPATYRDDARLTKIIPIHERKSLYLSFEAFNVTNTPVDTSITNQAFTSSNGIIKLTPTAYGQGTVSAGFPDGTNVRRAQVSARFVF